MSEFPAEEMKELAHALAALPPRPPQLSRDQLLFRAGQASVRRGLGWPLLTAGFALSTLGLAAILWLRPIPDPLVRIVHVPVPAALSPASPPEETFPDPPPSVVEYPRPDLPYWRLQEQVLRFGLDALPPLPPMPPETTPREPLTVQSLLDMP